MLKKEVLLAIILVLMAAPAAADTDDWFLTTDMAKLNVVIGSDMKLTSIGQGSYINYVQADMSFLVRNGPHQTISKQTIEPDATEVDDGLRFRWESPATGTLKFEVATVLTTNYQLSQVDKKVAFPIDRDDILSSVRKYTEPSEYIDSDDKDIIRLASELAEGEDDLFKVVFTIADWVMGNLRYDITVGRRVESASWILENRRGVCDEYSTLFIGLVRSIGIPARYISGIAYSNLDIIQGFGPHAWVEVYFPEYGWIPFDFTYGELGYVDSTHVKLRNSLDPGESSTKYEWEGYLVKLDTNPLIFNTEVLGHGDHVKPLLDIDIDIAKPRVGFGSYNLITVELENTVGYYVPTAVQISQTNGMSMEDDNRKFVLLLPYGSARLSWITQVSSGLDSGFSYTFPVSATTSRNASDMEKFIAKEGEPVYSRDIVEELLEQLEEEEQKSYSKEVQLSCSAEPESVYLNKSSTISCMVENSGNSYLEDLEVCLEGDCSDIALGIGRSDTVTFVKSFDGLGKTELMVTAINDEVSKSEFVPIHVQERPALQIANISHPDLVNSSEKFSIEFAVRKTSDSSPSDIEIVLGQGINKKTWNIPELETDRKFIINLNGNELLRKENEFIISISYYGLEGERYSTESQFIVALENPSFSSRTLAWSEDILLGTDGMNWKIIALTAVIFGLIIGIVFKRKPRRALW